jgi:two-component system, NarL family, invasion response regulator UvrY
MLQAEADCDVVGRTGLGKEAVQLAESLRPDVVLLDFSLPDQDGLETTRQILALGGGTRVLILTMYANEEYATRLIQAGASGFVGKAASEDELLAALRKVAAKGVYISLGIMEKMVTRIGQPLEESPEAALSNRELQVLVRLGRGESTREVSEALELSVSTVETYRSRILEKLTLRNNSDLTRFALRRGLIDLY